MKRSPLKRTAWLRRGLSRLKRFVGVKPRRATPRRKAHPANRALRQWVASQRCCLGADLSHDGTVDPHHVRTRGAGGGELANLVPLCRYHHDVLHNMGRRSFAAQYGVNLPELAQEYTLRFQIETGAAPQTEARTA